MWFTEDGRAGRGVPFASAGSLATGGGIEGADKRLNEV